VVTRSPMPSMAKLLLVALLTVSMLVVGGPAALASNNHTSGRHDAGRSCYFHGHHRWSGNSIRTYTYPTVGSELGGTCKRLRVELWVRKSNGTVWKYTDIGYPLRIINPDAATIGTTGRLIRTRHCAQYSYGSGGNWVCFTMY
jgi:hypothetical protein